MSETRERVDWDALEPHYRAGIRALKDVGREFGCSDAAIIKHAKAFGWTRNLTAKIRAKAETKIAAALIRAETGETNPVTEAVRVEIEAEVQSRVQLEHRDILKRLRASVHDLVALVNAERALKLRVLATKALAETAAKLIPLERQAYGIDKVLPSDPHEEIDPMEGARRLAFALARADALLIPTVH